MRQRVLLGLVMGLVLGVVLLVGCGDDADTTTTLGEPETTTTEAGATETTGATGEVDGQEVFVSTCSVCHAEDGTGGTGPDLTALSLEKDRVADQVTNGGGAMPAYGDQLSDEEIDAVATYVSEELMQ